MSNDRIAKLEAELTALRNNFADAIAIAVTDHSTQWLAISSLLVSKGIITDEELLAAIEAEDPLTTSAIEAEMLEHYGDGDGICSTNVKAKRDG